MARLPTPGGDNNDWGDILNAYLSVSHNSDGTLASNTVGSAQLQSGGVGTSAIASGAITTALIANNAVTNTQLDSPTQATLSSVAGKYTKPGSGIPSSDMTSAVQTSLGLANTSVQSVNNVTPTSGNVSITASSINAVATSTLGAASGVATLNGSSQLTSSQLPSSVVNASGATDLYVPIANGSNGYSWGPQTGSGGDATVVAGGNLGATYTLALASAPLVQFTGTLTANCALTVTGLTAGCNADLLLAQNSTGGYTLTINGTAVAIPSAAGAPVVLSLWSPDGTTLWIQPAAINGTNGTNGTNGAKWWNGVGVPGTVAGASTGDYYVDQANGEVYKSTSGSSTWADQGFSIQGSAGTSSRAAQRLKVIGGALDWTLDPYANWAALSNQSLSTQVMYGTLMGFNAGDVVNDIWVIVGTAGAGTPPTGIYLALYSTAGVQLAVSANVASSANWTNATTRDESFAMGAPYTWSSAGAGFLCVLANGTWGTTQLQLKASTAGMPAVLSHTTVLPTVEDSPVSTPPTPATLTYVATNIVMGFS